MSNSPDLLGLPPELRNAIWRLVLVKTCGIHLYPSDRRSPQLLQVNRQIRSEAVGIHYGENVITFHCHHTRGDWVLKYLDLAQKHSEPPISYRYSLSGRRDWENLIQWAQACHERGSPDGGLSSLAGDASTSSKRLVPHMILSIAKLIKSQPWDEVEAALQSYHPVAIRMNHYWT